jgi:hypothetical protein
VSLRRVDISGGDGSLSCSISSSTITTITIIIIIIIIIFIIIIIISSSSSSSGISLDDTFTRCPLKSVQFGNCFGFVSDRHWADPP